MKVQRYSIAVAIVTAILFASLSRLSWVSKTDVISKANESTGNGTPKVSARDLVVCVPGLSGSGTGFISRINGRLFFATNMHVLAELESDTLTTRTAQSIKLPDYGYFSKSRDVALVPIEWNGSAFETVSGFSNVSPAVHDDVTVVTIGQDGKSRRNKGSIVDILPDMIETTPLFEPGNSGSPLIHDTTGIVVGIASFKQYASRRPNTFRYFCYRVDRLDGMQKSSLEELRCDAKFTREFSEANDVYDTIVRAVRGDSSRLSVQEREHAVPRKAVDILRQYSLWDGERVQTQKSDRLVKLVSDLRESAHAARTYLDKKLIIAYYREWLTASVQKRMQVVERIESYLSERLSANSGPSQVTQSSESGGAPKNEFRWPIASHPEARLVHGWISFDKTDGELAVREHAGGGSSRSPIDEPLELVLRTQAKEGTLHLQIIRQWDGRSASLGSKTSCPKGTTIRVKEPIAFSGLTTEYQVLWRADFVEAEEIVKSVAYVGRLSPIAEQYDGFGRQELAKVRAALYKSEGLSVNNRMRSDSRASRR